MIYILSGCSKPTKILCLKKKEPIKFNVGRFTNPIYLALKGDIENFHYDSLEMVDGVVVQMI